MKWRRRAQSGAAVLIALIALLILLYVLFLPPADRAALLGETPAGGVPPVSTPQNTLLSTVPSVDSLSGVESRTLPAFSVQTVTSGNVLAERNSIHVERSVFHNTGDSLTFNSPNRVGNILLTFTVAESTGRLLIELNGEIIFADEINRRQAPPITIPSEKLLPVNELRFFVSGVGFSVWKKNSFTIENVRVTGDVTTFDEASQTQRFVVTDLRQVKRAQLRFRPDCFEDAGRLSIYVNDEILYNGKPECGIEVPLDMATQKLFEGENRLSWAVTSGRYVIDDVSVITEGPDSRGGESFSVPSDLYSRVISDQNRDILLSLSFRDAGAQGVISVNGEELAFRTHKQSFAAPITRYVSAGSNTVTIKETSSDVTLLEVVHN